MEELSLTRKERERLFRKGEIITAAERIFAEKGFSSTTLDDIAESAEFGKGTLYNYFKGKEEIYVAIVDDVITNIERIINEADIKTKTFIEFIETSTRELFNYCDKNKNAFLIFVRELARFDRDYKYIKAETLFRKFDHIEKIFVKRVESGIKAKEIKKYNPEKMWLLYSHLSFPYLHHALFCSPTDISIDEETNLILSVLLDGIKSE